MTRVAPILGAVATAAALPGSAAEQAAAHATVVDATNIRMSWFTAMPSVRADAAGAAFSGDAPSMGMARMVSEPGAVVVRRQDDTGAPITAPTTFEVVTGQGEDALIVKTGASSELHIRSDGAIVGGAITGDNAASIEVTRAAEGQAGAALVVTVQYN